MYELEQVGESTYYINCPTRIGIYKKGKDVYIIDSGNDKDTAKKVLKIIEQNSWNLKAVINTHSHADHIGGNNYLQKQTNCLIFTNGAETTFTKYPILEPSMLYGGYPFAELRQNKFICAKDSDVLHVNDCNFPKELEIISLPGHSLDMIAVRTPDDVIFLADSIISRDILEKYKITYVYNVSQFLESLDKVENLHAKLFIPAHSEASPDIKDLVKLNRNITLQIGEKILDICKNAIDTESIINYIFSVYDLKMSMIQYVLIGSTIRSYLSWLKDSKKLNIVVENNKLLWQTNN